VFAAASRAGVASIEDRAEERILLGIYRRALGMLADTPFGARRSGTISLVLAVLF
jgi:hypothetical protein